MSTRMKSVQPPPLVNLMKLATSTEGCISLAQGVPSYSPPKELLAEFAKLLTEQKIHTYTADPGTLELRKSISSMILQDFSIKSTASEIVVTPGANQAFINVILSLCDPKDRVMLLSPYYFNHKMALDMFGFKSVIFETEDDFSIDYSKLKPLMKDVKVLVLVNPGNPSGYSYSQGQLRELANFLKSNSPDVVVVSDETYNYFSYVWSFTPMRNLYPRTITLGSLSKSFGIPGWRIGYYHIPESEFQDLMDLSLKVQDTTVICASHASQELGNLLIQRRTEFLSDFISITKNNHRIASEQLAEIHALELPPHNAAYYIFPKIIGRSSYGFDLANSLIREFKVAVVPGEVFGKRWKNNLRISFANVDAEVLSEGLRRIKLALDS